MYQTVEEGEVVKEEQSQHDKHNKEDPSEATCPKGITLGVMRILKRLSVAKFTIFYQG